LLNYKKKNNCFFNDYKKKKRKKLNFNLKFFLLFFQSLITKFFFFFINFIIMEFDFQIKDAISLNSDDGLYTIPAKMIQHISYAKSMSKS
jgi:hypothetical protein